MDESTRQRLIDEVSETKHRFEAFKQEDHTIGKGLVAFTATAFLADAGMVLTTGSNIWLSASAIFLLFSTVVGCMGYYSRRQNDLFEAVLDFIPHGMEIEAAAKPHIDLAGAKDAMKDIVKGMDESLQKSMKFDRTIVRVQIVTAVIGVALIAIAVLLKSGPQSRPETTTADRYSTTDIPPRRQSDQRLGQH